MADRSAFQQKQYEFAAHIRDPQQVPAPLGIEDRRMAIYRELFFNNLKSLLANMFPVLRKLHDDAHWNHFIREFMRHHTAKTPYFLELPEEFLAFLQNEYEHRVDDFPFLVELAHYEYVELALSISTETNNMSGVDPHGDLLAGIPVKSVLAWMYAYQYPVHRISSKFLPEKPQDQPVYLAVYRKRDDEVGFLELNPVSAHLLTAIEENEAGKNGRELLRDIAADINYLNVDAFISHGSAALEEMRELEIVTGARAGNNQEYPQ
ncbi:MAG: putative DNA-binding domain-containing protein [Woeseiaceae bacterium]|nr:putative DNA-binding domain-containing protein [Woeseiaceae bacterium]